MDGVRIERLNVEVVEVEDVVEIEVAEVEDAVMIDNLAAEVDASNAAKKAISRVNVPMHHNHNLIQSVINVANPVTFLVNVPLEAETNALNVAKRATFQGVVLKEVVINVLIAKAKATFPETAPRKGK